jgi:D-alanyl-D-alanine carboxypeptidase
MLQNSFTPIYTNKKEPSKWKGIVSVGSAFAVVFILGGLWFMDFGKNVRELAVNPITFSERSVAGIKVSSFGGDISIDPPEPVEVLLPKLNTEEIIDRNKFSASNIIVKDVETGALLYSKNEYEQHPIASVTKLMSALVLLEKEVDWDATTQVISDNIMDTHMYAGDTYTLDDLWYSALVGSSNKAIMTLADSAGWPREAFVERMNQKALELGMTDTYFQEPTGLSMYNVSTASDLVLLLEEVMKHDKIKSGLLTSEHDLYSVERSKKHHMWNTNWLLLNWVTNDFSELCGKTGYIGASGYNFVMKVKKDKEENNHEIYVVVLGTVSNEARFTESRDIANWVFENYNWPE